MTRVGAGGVVIRTVSLKETFKRDRDGAPPDIQGRLNDKLRHLLANPHPRGLRFEKLKGFQKPSIFTFHVTGNWKVSLEIVGDHAILRRLAVHKVIDKSP